MSKISETQSVLNVARNQIIDAFMRAKFLSDRDSSRLQRSIELAVHKIDEAIAVLEKFRHRYEQVPAKKPIPAKPHRPRVAS